jgi:hypothetical protein
MSPKPWIVVVRGLFGALAIVLSGCDEPLKNTADDELPVPMADDSSYRLEVAIDVIAIEAGMVVAALKRRQ